MVFDSRTENTLVIVCTDFFLTVIGNALSQECSDVIRLYRKDCRPDDLIIKGLQVTGLFEHDIGCTLNLLDCPSVAETERFRNGADDKFGCVLRIESTCNDIGTFRVKRKVEHRDGSSTEQKAPLKKSIYSLYQLFTIMKAANYRYLEFVSSFDDHSGGKKNLTKATEAVKEKGRSYRGLNFFSPKDLLVLEVISRGE